ncbi:MAG TPA: hypothetical protein VFV87_22510, partial [Pirellulaceae bacterium]|nr:hypothetical protein [Pirellulaceae bacterium]
MFNSIRWTMLGWQALILGLVVGGLGTALYRQVRHATYEQMDAELLGAAQAVALKIEAGQQPALPASFVARFGKVQERA